MTQNLRTLAGVWLFSLFPQGGRAVAAPSQGAEPTPEEVQRTLDAVFKRAEFDESPSWTPNFAKLVAEFFRWLASLYGSNPLLYWGLLVGCVILLALLVTHLVWVIYSAFSFNVSRSGMGDRAEQRRRLSGAFAEAAEKAARVGDYTEAVRCLFLCLVYHLDESGRVTYRPSGTNREYLRDFADRPTVHRDLAIFVDTLDDNWYGQQTTPPEQYQRCRSVFDAIYRLG